jgi:hypothetical protein
MTIRLATKVLGMLAGLCLTLGASVAHAVPVLQVYVEGAVYDSAIETWVLDTANSSGTVTITATTQNGNSGVRPIDGVQMVVSALDDDSFSATLTGGDANLDLVAFSGAGSSPILNGGDANSAASYLSFGLGSFGGNADATFDYNDPDADGNSSGNSQTYVLTLTDLTGTVIIDAYGFDSRNRLVFAPYSHNGAMTIVSDVPEFSATGATPAATLLLGALALLHSRRRRTLA